MKILESRRDDSSGRPFQKLLFHCARTHDFITPPLSQLSSALTEDSKCTISHPSKKPDSLWDPQKWWCFHWLSAQTTWSLTACVFFHSLYLPDIYLSSVGLTSFKKGVSLSRYLIYDCSLLVPEWEMCLHQNIQRGADDRREQWNIRWEEGKVENNK